MSTNNRKRKKMVAIRMTDSEYDLLKLKVEESGLSQQTFIINSIKDNTCITAKTISDLKDTSKNLTSTVNQIHKTLNDIKQIAYITDKQDEIMENKELEEISDSLDKLKREIEEQWQLIRLSISKKQLINH